MMASCDMKTLLGLHSTRRYCENVGSWRGVQASESYGKGSHLGDLFTGVTPTNECKPLRSYPLSKQRCTEKKSRWRCRTKSARPSCLYITGIILFEQSEIGVPVVNERNHSVSKSRPNNMSRFAINVINRDLRQQTFKIDDLLNFLAPLPARVKCSTWNILGILTR